MTGREKKLLRVWSAVAAVMAVAVVLLPGTVGASRESGRQVAAHTALAGSECEKQVGLAAEPAETVVGRDDIVCGDNRLSYILQEYLQELCEQYRLDYALVLALAETESGFDPLAENPDTHCFGLLQVHPCNYKEMAERGIDMETVAGSIEAGCVILRDKLSRHGTAQRALMAYHCGDAGAEALWREGVTETAYTRTVLERYRKWMSVLK